MSDEEEESEEVKKETVGFAWSSQACQVRIVVCLFILSVLLGALTAYIIIPRLKEDCKKYHAQKAAANKGQAKRGLAIPAANHTDEVNSTSDSAVSNERYAPTRNGGSSPSTISGPPAKLPASVHTQQLPDDIARGMSGQSTVDLDSDSKGDNDDVVVIVETERKIGTALGPTFGGTTDAAGDKLSVTNGIASRDLTSASPVIADRTTAAGSVSEAHDTTDPAMSSATKKYAIKSSAASEITTSATSSSSLGTPVLISYGVSHTRGTLSGNLPKYGIATLDYLPNKGAASVGTKDGIMTTSGDAVTGARQLPAHATSEGSFDGTGTDAVRNVPIESTPSFQTTPTSLSAVSPSGTNSFLDLVVRAITKEHAILNGTGAFLVTADGATESELQNLRRTKQEGGLSDAAADVSESPRFEGTLNSTTVSGTLPDYYPLDASSDFPENTKERDLVSGKRVSDDTQDDPLERASSTVVDEDQEFYLRHAGQLPRLQQRWSRRRA